MFNNYSMPSDALYLITSSISGMLTEAMTVDNFYIVLKFNGKITITFIINYNTL